MEERVVWEVRDLGVDVEGILWEMGILGELDLDVGGFAGELSFEISVC